MPNHSFMLATLEFSASRSYHGSSQIPQMKCHGNEKLLHLRIYWTHLAAGGIYDKLCPVCRKVITGVYVHSINSINRRWFCMVLVNFFLVFLCCVSECYSVYRQWHLCDNEIDGENSLAGNSIKNFFAEIWRMWSLSCFSARKCCEWQLTNDDIGWLE